MSTRTSAVRFSTVAVVEPLVGVIEVFPSLQFPGAECSRVRYVLGKPGVFTDRSVLDGDGQVLAVAVVGVDFRAECAYPGTVIVAVHR